MRNDRAYRSTPFAFGHGLPEAGSALIALNIAAELCDAFANEVVLATDLSKLRDRRVRHVIFIDDYIGSGRSVVEFLRLWRGSPTIRSWQSYHLLQFHLVAYSYASTGIEALAASGNIDMRNVRTHTTRDDIYGANWTASERDEIIDVCLRYADKQRNALGVGDVGALIAFDHTVPNNLPRVLLQDKGRGGLDWAPFFPPGDRRLDPAQAAELMGYRPDAEWRTSMDSPGALDAEQELLARHMRLVLRAIAPRARFARDIQDFTGLTDFQVRHLLKRAAASGLTTEDGALTEAGLAWLEKEADRRADDNEIEPGYYYPTQLRGADEI